VWVLTRDSRLGSNWAALLYYRTPVFVRKLVTQTPPTGTNQTDHVSSKIKCDMSII
jgi:hypothetical protein